MELLIFPEMPEGNRDQEVSLFKPVSFGHLVCVQRSSTVGGIGIPLRFTAYVAVPPVIAGLGKSYATQRLTLSPAFGFAGTLS